MDPYSGVDRRAEVIARAGSLRKALAEGSLERYQDVSLSEALVLGLMNQGVRKYIGVLGHGNTDIANILSIYERHGLVRMYNLRHETEAAHCASILKWQYGETAAVITSIGPGALHAYAGSLVSASNGLGVYHIYGDQTTHDEGPNMQQIPGSGQGAFLRLAQTMGGGYVLHTPPAVFSALRHGAATVFNPSHPAPFFFLVPMNAQPMRIEECNLAEFPDAPPSCRQAACDEDAFARAVGAVRAAKSVVIKFGGGARDCGPQLIRLAELADAVLVCGAKMAGVVPYSHPRFMGVGGSKGSLCGNHAMENADLVIVVGSRSVCQWDCSGTAWKKAGAVINLNTRVEDAWHYNRSIILLGDAKANLAGLISRLEAAGAAPRGTPSAWLTENREEKAQWQLFKRERFDHPLLHDEAWGRKVLTQPAAIWTAYQFAREKGSARYFDAGDVQANGFQLVEDEEPGLTYSETGSSYMGFAVSALLSTAVADRPVHAFAFTGDGSFMMNPQILIDGVQHGVRGCIVLFDNRRMAAISSLQKAQYDAEYKTWDSVAVDYVALARSVKGVEAFDGGGSVEGLRDALERAYSCHGLSLVHVPVYNGDDEMGGLGVYGAWNVGNWCADVQREHHRMGL
jgi:thiamine pyrophosphate-dependent acetolactate synthase large subunit-like protein